MAQEWKQNKDRYGNELYNPAAEGLEKRKQQLASLGKQLAPFSVSNVMNLQEMGRPKIPMWQSMMGMTPAPSERILQSPLLESIERTRPGFPAHSPAEQKHADARKELAGRIANGKPYDDLLSSSAITSQDVRAAQKAFDKRSGPNGPLVYALEQSSLNLIIDKANVARDNELPVVLDVMQRKYRRAHNLNVDQKEEYMRTLKKLQDRMEKLQKPQEPNDGQPRS